MKIPQDALEYMRLQVNESTSQQVNKSESKSELNYATDVMTGDKIEYNLNEVSSRGIAMSIDAAGFKIIKL